MYKLINEKANYFIDDILEVVCRNRGIEDINKIKNPSENDVIHYSKLVNMDRAVKLFDAFIQTGEVIDVATIQDTDGDGATSSAALTMYLEKNFPNIRMHFLFHSGKQHGITDEIMKQIEELDNLDILFVPDAGSNDVDYHQELYSNGIPTIILDHHDVNTDSNFAIVVNSQMSPEYENKQFSGVGITYKFLQCLDDKYGFNDADTFLDLVSVGNVADMQDLTEKETRYYVYEGIKQINNPLLKEMIYKTIGKYEDVNPNSLAFNLIPKMNAIFRVGTMEEKKDLFYAMIGREEMSVNSRTKKEENLQQKATRQAVNAHQRQNNVKKKWLAKIREEINANELYNQPFIVIKFNKKDKFDNNLSGVIANTLLAQYRKPVLILTYNEEKDNYGGSMRGYDGFISNTKTYLESLGLFEWVQGHEQAAGCCISSENLDKLNKVVIKDKTLKFESNTKEIEVDFVIASKNMRGGIVEEVHKYEKYFGKGIEKPKFCITDVKIDMNEVKVSSGGMIKMHLNGIDYTQFVAVHELAQYAEKNVELTMDLVGTLSVSKFLGKTSNQMIIDEIDIKNVEESTKRKVLFEF